jgi:hypothetical protein
MSKKFSTIRRTLLYYIYQTYSGQEFPCTIADDTVLRATVCSDPPPQVQQQQQQDGSPQEFHLRKLLKTTPSLFAFSWLHLHA